MSGQKHIVVTDIETGHIEQDYLLARGSVAIFLGISAYVAEFTQGFIEEGNAIEMRIVLRPNDAALNRQEVFGS